MLKAIFFDATGTLIHLPRGVGHHYAQVARNFGLEIDDRLLDDAFHRAWKKMPARAASRAPRPDDDKGWWRELVGRVLDDCGVCAEFDREAYFAKLYAHFAEPGVWELHPEVMGVLVELSRRFRLGVISNFDGRLRVILDGLGVAEMFEQVVISSEVGADKPDGFIFKTALDRFGIASDEALHAGDDPVHDWRGAEEAGLRSFRLDRRKNSLTDLLPLAARLATSARGF